MIQANEIGKAVTGLSPSHSSQQATSWFARNTKDVSDASLVEFERLMAAMGYRQRETNVGGASSTKATAR